MSAKIDVADEGDTITVRVGDAGRVESRRLRDPQGQGFTLRGGGFVTGLGMEEVDLSPSRSRWTDSDLRQSRIKLLRPWPIGPVNAAGMTIQKAVDDG